MIFPSTIIVCKDTNQINTQLSAIASELKSNLSPNNPDLFRIDSTSGWGIDVVRSIKKFLSQRPIKYATKIVIIYEADNLGIESQNALLKSLEEPPEDSYIILITSTKQSLLPTILSRSHVISLLSNNPILDTPLLRPQENIRDCLQLSESITQNKETVQGYIENQIVLYQKQMIQDPSFAPTLKKLLKTLQMIQANIDPKAAIDWFLLS